MEQDKQERNLNLTPKKDQKKQAKETASEKVKSPNKRAAKTDVEERKEETSSPAKTERVEEDGKETPGRRRSSRVARNEAMAKQAHENEEKEKSLKKEENEGANVKKRTLKKNSGNEEKMEVNGEHDDEHGENEQDAAEEAEVNEEREEKQPWSPVYITRFEVQGLNKLIEKLRKWPQAKKNVPSSLEDPYGLLDTLEVCVEKQPTKILFLINSFSPSQIVRSKLGYIPQFVFAVLSIEWPNLRISSSDSKCRTALCCLSVGRGSPNLV